MSSDFAQSISIFKWLIQSGLGSSSTGIITEITPAPGEASILEAKFSNSTS